MKPTPASSTHCATPSAERSIATPSASSTSAEPHSEEMERLPCFATRAPAPATTSAAIVEMFTLPDRSPPVPHVSIAASAFTRTLCSCIVRRHAAISSAVSPLARIPKRKAPVCPGVASPESIARIAAAAAGAPTSSRRASASSTSGHENSVMGAKYRCAPGARDDRLAEVDAAGLRDERGMRDRAAGLELRVAERHDERAVARD
jgi:hypothetical protein